MLVNNTLNLLRTLELHTLKCINNTCDWEDDKYTYTFTVNCPELNTNVKRTLEDFEFFKSQLIEKYPFIYIPPLPPRREETKVYDQDLLMRYLNRFFKSLVRKKILRTSPITLEFLELDTLEFEKYKEMLLANKFVVKYN